MLIKKRVYKSKYIFPFHSIIHSLALHTTEIIKKSLDFDLKKLTLTYSTGLGLTLKNYTEPGLYDFMIYWNCT